MTDANFIESYFKLCAPERTTRLSLIPTMQDSPLVIYWLFLFFFICCSDGDKVTTKLHSTVRSDVPVWSDQVTTISGGLNKVIESEKEGDAQNTTNNNKPLMTNKNVTCNNNQPLNDLKSICSLSQSSSNGSSVSLDVEMNITGSSKSLDLPASNDRRDMPVFHTLEIDKELENLLSLNKLKAGKTQHRPKSYLKILPAAPPYKCVDDQLVTDKSALLGPADIDIPKVICRK